MIRKTSETSESRKRNLTTLTNQDVTRTFFNVHGEDDQTRKVDRKWRTLGKLTIRDLSRYRVR